MFKELVTIELRYTDNSSDEPNYKSRTITVGVFDTLEEAIEEGNKAIESMADKFEVREDDKFKKNFLWGSPKRLVTNTCYPTNGVQYFAKIERLSFDDLGNAIEEAFRV